MGRIIDSDHHFMEPFTVYEEHAEPGDRDLALRVERDELGWPWLSHRGQRLFVVDSHVPGRVDHIGEQRRRFAAGKPFEAEAALADACDPAARVAHLDAAGVDAAIVYPNLSLGWEKNLARDARSHCANLRAYNTWILEQLPDCGDRLFPVAHLTLRDLAWFESEIRRCARAGVKLGMIAAQQVGGRSLAHPALDRVWALFQDLDMAVTFHVASDQLPLHDAWYALDPQPGNKLLETTFLYLAPAVAVTSLIVHGVLERFPRLRIGITELSAGWVPGHLMHLDGAFAFYEQQNGRPLAELPMRPSEYFRRQVRVNAFPLEGAPRLGRMAGAPIFAWGSDYPHAEGMREPSWTAYLRAQRDELDDAERDALAGGNAAFLIGEA